MERVMSVEERIKRAEDIYNRRNGQYSKVGHKEEKKVKKRSTVKKMLMQIFICLVIYVCFYGATNSEYVFSEEFRNEMQKKFSAESFNQMFVNIKDFIDKKILNKKDEEKNLEDDKKEEENPNNETDNNINDEVNNENNSEININDGENSNEEGIGGAEGEELNSSQEETSQEISSAQKEIEEDNKENANNEILDEVQQMKKDAEDIKSSISFIVPVDGKISSKFGWREPTTSTVPKNHKGLDIAAVKGTVIKSATDGVVTLASSKGDYGKHYYIEINGITIIYAHCSKLYLSEGDNVKQGQEIAEVGSTGNSTRASFTF